MGFQIVSGLAFDFETHDLSSGELMRLVFIYVIALYLAVFFVSTNSSVVKKDQLEGVSYPFPDLDRSHPCLLIERGGVRDRVDIEEYGRRMSRRKKAKVFTFLNNVVTVRLPQCGVH